MSFNQLNHKNIQLKLLFIFYHLLTSIF